MNDKYKLHVRYIGIIALIITLGSVILAGYNNDAFVGQFSFASTITSIILSVVAIWMSISGERNTNSIKDKVEDAVDDLNEVNMNIKSNIDGLVDFRLSLNNILDGVTYMRSRFDSLADNINNTYSNLVIKNYPSPVDPISDETILQILKIIRDDSLPVLHVFDGLLYYYLTKDGYLSYEEFRDKACELISKEKDEDDYGISILFGMIKILAMLEIKTKDSIKTKVIDLLKNENYGF
jgi:hypothetical protein